MTDTTHPEDTLDESLSGAQSRSFLLVMVIAQKGQPETT